MVFLRSDIYDLLRFADKDVVEAVELYSQWKLEDLANEYLANYPFLDGLLAIFRDRGYLVTRTALDWRLPKAREVLAERFPERTEALTTDGVLDVLYDIGFLGVRRNDHVVYAARQGGRVELTDEEFHVHPAFRAALRAHRASIMHDFEPERIAPLVRSRLANYRGDELRRGTDKVQLGETARNGVQRLLDGVEDGDLPPETSREISAGLRRILHSLDDLSYDRSPVFLEQIDHIGDFLQKLAGSLEADGFAEDGTSRFFVRSICDLARRLRRIRYGGSPHNSGGW